MSNSGVTRKGWSQRILAIVVSSLTAVTMLAMVPGRASAAPKSTTTTAPSTTTTSTTTASGGNGVANPKLVAVVALSRHRTLATYDQDLDAAALQPSSYIYNSTQNVNLPVVSVTRASNNQAFVITGPQEPVTYQVKKPKTPHQLTFTGSTLVEPKVVKATPLSKTQIVVTFSEPVGPSGVVPSHYVITVEGSTATLNVESATTFGSSGTQVLLTTAPQAAVNYILTVVDVQGTSGVYVDPTAASTAVTGSTAAPRPMLIAVVALSRHRTLATYDRDLDDAALQASSYAYYATESVNLPVVSVARASNNQAFVITGPQQAVTYQVKAPETSQQLTFTGSTTVEPRLEKATPVSSTQILVTFSDPVGPSALQPSHYAITVAGSSTTLNVTSAVAFGSTGKEILLTTAPQDPVRYLVTIVDVQGTNGAYVDPTATSTDVTGSTVPPGPMLLNASSSGSTQVILTFDSLLDPVSAGNPANYASTPNLFITAAAVQSDNRQVVLTTGPQYQVDYTIVANIRGANGNPANPTRNSAPFKGTGDAVNSERPTVVGAASTGNKTVVVQFSKPMADGTADTSHFAIVQTVTNPESGALTVTAAKFLDGARLSVQLTTLSQAEVSYQVTVSNVTDMQGNPLADKTARVDPTSASFAGTPPAYLPCPRPDAPNPCVVVDERVNSDGDSLWDHEETRGWQITVKLANGQTQVRQVTSNPYSADTDNDGISDNDERALNIDPRDTDTDDDGLGDEPEYNVYYSDPANQDTDADGLFDGLETGFFHTSPIFDDTDGDQLKDGYEINVNRNPNVADLPQPVLEVGQTHMGLDVRFTESNGQSTRQLDAKSVESTLSQSSSEAYSSTDSATHEASTQIGTSAGFSVGYDGGFTGEVHFDTTSETTNTNSFTSDFSASSEAATEQAYTNSLSTEVEAAQDSTVTREVNGAQLSLAVTLRSAGNVGFTARNLQIAALIQDPDDPTRLTPIATLVPDSGLDTSFTLGPLVPPKGPIVFSTSSVFPQLVDELMKNPRGLVFRFANYDIVDEAGRNFAFTSQDVNDRTARVAIDYGGFDPDGDGQGQATEILRVATGIIGRVVDTNGDGIVDARDRKVVFDPSGHQVGITLREALGAAGLTAYDEATTPSSSLSAAQKQNSYSTKVINGTEILFRIRNRQVNLSSPESWEVVDHTGIDRSLSLDKRILYPGTNVTLMFLQDVDRDGLPAVTESVHGCKDTAADTDGDTLTDRFEVLIGWSVQTPAGPRTVRSRCSASDSDGDGLNDRAEAPGNISTDANGRFVLSRNTALTGVEGAVADPVTDPTNRDTDGDGLPDNFELTPYKNAINLPLRQTSPEHPDSDGDGLPDGVERKLGGDPRVNDAVQFTDSDHDGLTDAQEVGDDNGDFVIDDHERGSAGWDVTVTQMAPRLDSPDQLSTEIDSLIAPGHTSSNVYHFDNAARFRPGMIVIVKNAVPADLRTTVDKVDLDFLGPSGNVTFGTPFSVGSLTPFVDVYPALCENGSCPVGHATTVQHVYSSKFDPDTDHDGLSDFEEYQLKTDPGCQLRTDTAGQPTVDCKPNQATKDLDGDGVRDGWDTDHDGLTDFQEVRGFKLQDGATVKTKPTFVDTDNDRRSDGEEAGLPGGEYIVRLPAGVAYQAFTNPTKADSDFDQLVDGDEQVFSTDPTKSNTDGDNQGDYSEVLAGRRPTVPDMAVKMNFVRLEVTKDGEKDGDAGDFQFEFNAVLPNGSNPLVVYSNNHPVAGIDTLQLDRLPGALPMAADGSGNCPGGNTGGPCWHITNNGTNTVVRIDNGLSVPFKLDGSGRVVNVGSVSTTDAVPEQFGISGFLQEMDGAANDGVACKVNIFPDIFGNPNDGTGLVKGSQLRLGVNSMAIHRSGVTCGDGDLDFTLQVSYTAL